MSLQHAPSSSYRGAHEQGGLAAQVAGRVLELASEAVNERVGAQEAWRAASDAGSHGVAEEPAQCLSVVQQAAHSLCLGVELRCGTTKELAAALVPQTAAAFTHDGETWWVVFARKRGLVVIRLSAAGEMRASVSVAQLREHVGEVSQWLQFGPHLALDEVSRHRDPSFVRRPWARLWAFLQLDRRDLGLVVVYALVVGVLTLATPVAAQALVNTIAFGSLLQPLFVLSVLLLGALVFASVLRAFETYVVEVLQRKIFVRVAEDLGRRVPRMEPSEDASTYRPELLNRFFEVVTIQKSLSVLLLDGLGLALQMLAGMLLLAFYHPLLLAFDVVLTLLLVAVLWMGRGAVATATAESDAKYAVAGWLEMLASTPAAFRTTSGARHASGWTQALCRDYLTARRHHFAILIKQISGGLGLQVFATVALLGIGGFLVISRQLTLGQLVAAELVVSALAAGFAKLGKHFEKTYDLVVSVKKLGKVIDVPCERYGGEPVRSTGPSCVVLDGVEVSAGGTPLLAGLDLSLGRGERVELAGPSGAGKSVLLEVLAGLRTPSGGSLTFDGVDMRRAELDTVREHIALVATPRFTHGSIMENIRLRRPDLDEAAIRPWLRLLALEHTISRLPHGLDTRLLPDGSPLSGTEVRRLMLLIALISKPGLLLLDGALDHLGMPAAAREELLDRVFAADAPWTAVVVTDDVEVASRCKRRISLLAEAEEGAR